MLGIWQPPLLTWEELQVHLGKLEMTPLEMVGPWFRRVLVEPGHSHVWKVTGYKLTVLTQGKNPLGIGRTERRRSEAPGGRGRPRVEGQAVGWVSRALQGSHAGSPKSIGAS